MEGRGHRRVILRCLREINGALACRHSLIQPPEVRQGHSALAVESRLQRNFLLSKAIDRLACHFLDRRIQEIVVDARHHQSRRAKQVGASCATRKFAGVDDRVGT